MIKRFISLEWKEFTRASYFQKGLAIKILLILAALYFGGMAIMMGVSLFFILTKLIPTVDPIVSVNNFLIYWLIFDLAIRFFMQQLPVMNVKPFMTIPIRRNSAIHFLLGKTMLSFFNFIPLFIFLPFSIVLLAKGYPALNVLCWLVAVMALSFTNNFINFLINKNNVVFYCLVTALAILIGLEYYGVFRVSEPIGVAFNALYEKPYLTFIPIILAIIFYKINFNFIRKGFYLDDAVSKKIKEVSATDLSWMDRFGSIAPFLKNDVKLIWRKCKAKTSDVYVIFIPILRPYFLYTGSLYGDAGIFSLCIRICYRGILIDLWTNSTIMG